MSDRLDEIRARAEAATPLMQWHRASLSGDHAKADHCNHSSADYCDYTGGEWTDLYALDPTDIEYLLAEVERLRAALGRIGIHATGCGMQFGHPCEFGCITVNFWTYATSALTEGGEL